MAEKYPTNYILLGFFTLFESIALGGLCASVGMPNLHSAHFSSIDVISIENGRWSDCSRSFGLHCYCCNWINTLCVGWEFRQLMVFHCRFQTKYDFISWAGGLMVVMLCLMTFGMIYNLMNVDLWVVLGFIRIFFPRSPVVEAIYAAAMALVFSVYILIDTQMLVSHSMSFPPKLSDRSRKSEAGYGPIHRCCIGVVHCELKRPVNFLCLSAGHHQSVYTNTQIFTRNQSGQ